MSGSSPTVADRLLQACTEAGVHTVFGLPGVHNLAFWVGEGSERPRIVGVRHEQTTVYAADGMARLTGGLGVALTTTGPGAANAAGAFGEAAAAKSPVVLIASEVPAAYAVRGQVKGLLHESRDQAAIFEPLAKAVFRPRTAEEACAAMGEAIATALASPRGPVYLDVPTDVLSQPGPAVVLAPPAVYPAADPTEIAAAAAAIEAAPRIVMWVGGGVLQSGAEQSVAALAAHLDAPVVTTYSAKGAVGADRPGVVGLPPHEPEVAALIAEADLLLAIGTDFDGMMTRNWRMPRPATLVSINIDADALTKNFEPDVGVRGDARAVVDALLAAVPAREPTVGADIEALRARVWEKLEHEPGAAFVKIIEPIVAEVPLVLDMAIPGYWLGGYAVPPRSRRHQYPVGWGTLGYALPASVGAAVAAGGPVLAVCGDGGFMFGLGELATIVQESLPVTLLLVDDGGYGMLGYDQDVAGHPRRGVDLARPDFVALAQSFGIGAVRLDTIDDRLGAAVKEALASGEPRLVLLETSMTPPRTTSPRWFE